MSADDSIISHYSAEGRGRRLLEAALRTAADPARLTTADLSAYDEMHVGGRRATTYLFNGMDLQPGMQVLDMGAGLGGPARCAAEQYGVHVTGIDLTPEFCETAALLSERTGLAAKTSFRVGNALELPFRDGAFDAVYTIHAAMNIAERARFYREARRVLKPGAVFGIYDIVAGEGGAMLDFPLPWSSVPETSFLLTAADMEEHLTDEGFSVLRSESLFADGMAALQARKAREGDLCSPKILNLIRGMEDGRCLPWLMICRAI